MTDAPIYLDYQATTPLDRRALDAMLPFLEAEFGNPHSIQHAFGQTAEAAVEKARGQIASLIGAEARERYGVSTMHGDYAKIAEGMGAVGIHVTKAAELAPALEEAKRLNAEGKTVLIDVEANVEERRSRFQPR